MRYAFLIGTTLVAAFLIASCSSDSGTIQPKVQQMKAGVRGHRGGESASPTGSDQR